MVYIGTLDRLRQLEAVIDGFREVVAKRPLARLVLIGSGSGEPDLRKRAQELGIGDFVLFIPRMPREEIVSYLQEARIGLSLVPPHPLFVIASPTKLFEYMAVGLPTLANRELKEQERIITESKAGALCSYTPDDIAKHLLGMLGSSAVLEQRGRSGRAYAQEHCSYRSLAAGLLQRYTALLEKHQP